MTKTVRKKKKAPLTDQQKKQNKLRKDIRSFLKAMGFEYLKTEGKNKVFGGQEGEIDSIYLYENILLICEDTITTTGAKDHIRKKNFFYEKIEDNKKDILEWLQKDYKNKFDNFNSYSNARYKIFYLYFYTTPIELDTRDLFPKIKFIDNVQLKYFKSIASTLKLSAINEMYRYLRISHSDVGIISSSTPDSTIDTAVILPEESSGFPEKVKLVSFMMCAEDLMDCAYVLRKEDWDNRHELYQRLVLPKKIKDIREFIAKNKKTFINNIIVSLPQNVRFYDSTHPENQLDLDQICDIRNLMMKIPRTTNSICIIDGQHRVFAHHKANDKFEPEISQIRERRHLLVTGLVFDEDISYAKRIQFESEIFLEINSTQKAVDPSLLQHIHAIKEPYSPTATARKVLVEMNERNPFLNHFKLYSFDAEKIPTPTIVRYALKDLVKISDESDTMYKYWVNDRKDVLKLDTYSDEFNEVYREYISFCAQKISQFFSAVKSNFNEDWTFDKSSKLLRVISVVGFIMSFKKSMEVYNEIYDYNFYYNKLSNLEIDFSKENFPYTSSLYGKFAEDVKAQCWKID